MTYTQEQIDAQYQKLPNAIKHVIFDVATAEKIFDTGQKYGLHIDQVGILADEVTYIMLGLTPASQFPQELQQKIGVGAGVATALGQDLNQAIFLPIREAMQKVTKPNLSELAPAAAPATLSAEQVLREVENPAPAPVLTKTAPILPPEQTEPDLLEKKLAKTFVLPRVESATKEDVDLYREIPR